MRIGLLIYGDLNMVSGGFLYDRLLVDYLRSRGDEVEVIPLKWQNYVGCMCHNLSSRLFGRLAHSGFDLLLEDEITHPSLFCLNYRLKAFARYPIVSIVHHLRCCEGRANWQNSLYRSIERFYLNSVHGFIFNSLTTRTTVQTLLRYEKGHVTAFPAGDHMDSHITQQQISKRALEPDRPVRILFVGNVTPRKQLHMLLDALTLVKGDWKLTVIGSLSADPSYTAGLYRKIELSGMASRVTLLGTLMKDELASALTRGDLLAVPSSYEGFGIVYLEAMAFGLPALASSSGGAKEIIIDAYNGFLVAPDDKWALALRIQKLIDNRNELASMGINARKSYLARPGWKESFSGIYDFLHSFR